MKWLVHNWGIKIVSLFLAVGLWYYAVNEENIEVTRAVPLEIKVKNAQLTVLKSMTRPLQVTFLAPRALLSEITSEEIRAVHEIGHEVKTAGDYSFRLEASEIQLHSPQIRVAKIEPSVIQLTLDEMIAKKLKITPRFVGEPAFGYKVSTEEIQLDPNALLFEGPRGQLEKLEAVDTEKIDLVGRLRSFRRKVQLMVPAGLKPLSDTLVDVYVPIREEFDEKTLENIPVRAMTSSDANQKVKVEPSQVTLVLKGSKRQLEKMDAAKLLAYIDVEGLPEGAHEVPVHLILPEEVALKDDKPVKVKAIISKP